ncbi:unnamed protein product, partial [Lymnaea stagnalis]
MKMMEARVKLANWAQTGEMPWKSSREEVTNNHNKVDSDGFVRPGVEAEKWIRSNKVSKVGGQNTPGTKRDQDYSGAHWSREYDSASSADSNVSFHTLDFEETTDQCSERDAYGHTPCNVKSTHAKNPCLALAEE